MEEVHVKWLYKDRWKQETIRRESLRVTGSCPLTLVVPRAGDASNMEEVQAILSSFNDSFIKRNMIEVRRWLRRHQTYRMNVDVKASKVNFRYDDSGKTAIATWQLHFTELLPPGPRPLP